MRIFMLLAIAVSLGASPPQKQAPKKNWYTYTTNVHVKPIPPDQFDPGMSCPEDPTQFKWQLVALKKGDPVPVFANYNSFRGSFGALTTQPEGTKVVLQNIMGLRYFLYYRVTLEGGPSGDNDGFWVAGTNLKASYAPKAGL